MKLSWIFIILLLIFVAVFSVQNADVMTVHFLNKEIQMSAALVIQLAALLGAMVGLACGVWSRRAPRTVEKPIEKPLEKSLEKPLDKPATPAPAVRNVTTPGSPLTLPSPSATPVSNPRPEKKPDLP